MSEFCPILFQPVRVNGLEIKNRIVMAPLGTNAAHPDGRVSSRLAGFLTARARGGVGLIITEDVTVGPNYHAQTLKLTTDDHLAGWQKLCGAVHALGAKIGPQLMHPGFNAPPALNDGAQPLAASPVASGVVPVIPREITVKEIGQVVEAFGRTAARAKAAGCDLVQLHAAHCHHLVGGFLSPLHNKRTDAYGGSLMGRARLLLEVIEAVRGAVGPDFPVLVRLSADEFLTGGRSLAETLYLVPLLARSGVDALHLSAGTIQNAWRAIPPQGSAQAPNAELAARIKAEVDIPVMVVGRISQPWAAETVIRSGQADMVSLGRALLADPDWPLKAAEGRWADIAPCVGDTSCMRRQSSSDHIGCLINPRVCREEEWPTQPAAASKRVLVIGGGPAGLSAAREAALRGHRVTLMEAGDKLGGQLLMAAFPPGKFEFSQAVSWLAGQAEQAGVEVILNRRADRAAVEELKPEAVILATGGRPLKPAGIPGLDQGHVVTAWDVLSGKTRPMGRVAILGGGRVGCETADFLAKPAGPPVGPEIFILEQQSFPALDDPGPNRAVLLKRLAEKGVELLTSARVEEVGPDWVAFVKQDRQERLEALDWVVLALGVEPVNQLAGQLEDGPWSLKVIGDAERPGDARRAVNLGARTGRDL